DAVRRRHRARRGDPCDRRRPAPADPAWRQVRRHRQECPLARHPGRPCLHHDPGAQSLVQFGAPPAWPELLVALRLAQGPGERRRALYRRLRDRDCRGSPPARRRWGGVRAYPQGGDPPVRLGAVLQRRRLGGELHGAGGAYGWAARNPRLGQPAQLLDAQPRRRRMRIAIVSDAWLPQINGVVRTLMRTMDELAVRGHETRMISPDLFRNLPCPTYSEIRLAVLPARRLGALIDKFQPCAIHIATEGPLGHAARRYCLARRLPFTTAFHPRFPEYIKARTGLPLGAGYTVMRRFHAPSSGVMVATSSLEQELQSRGFHNLRRWSRGVDTIMFRPRDKSFLDLPRPIHLYVGR